jgi:membrane fusion protein (multidrug efflux system)
VTKTVQTANWLGSDWIVTAGLAPGDAVIVDNLMKLRPGALVKVQGDAPTNTAAPAPEPGAREANPQPAR